MRMRSYVRLVIAAALAAGAAPAMAQSNSTQTRTLGGSGAGVPKEFHGSLGSRSLDGFRSFSSSVPGNGSAIPRPGSPLSATGTTQLKSGTLGGLGRSMRVTGSLSQGGVSSAGTTSFSSIGGMGSSLAAPLDSTLSVSGSSEVGELELLDHLSSSPGTTQLRRITDLSGPVIAASPRASVAAFELDRLLADNEHLSRSADLLRQGKLSAAADELHVALIFAPARPEPEWLLAIVHTAAGRYSDAVARLRNALAYYPDLLAGRRGVSDYLPAGVADAVVAAASRDADAAILAAWLSVDQSQSERAETILADAPAAVGAAAEVGYLLRLELSGRLGRAVGSVGQTAPQVQPFSFGPAEPAGQAEAATRPAGEPTAAPTARSAVQSVLPSGRGLSVERWVDRRGDLMGLPPQQLRFRQGQLDVGVAQPE